MANRGTVGSVGSADMKYHLVTALIAAIAAIAAMMLADPPLEDQPGWDCRTMGNHVCGKV